MMLNTDANDLPPLEACLDAGAAAAGPLEAAPSTASPGLGRRIGALLAGQTARKSALAIADQVVYGATTFAASILIARAAGSRELGVYTLGLSLALIGLDLQNSLVLIPYTVFKPHCRPPDAARFEGAALLHTLLLGLPAMAAFAVLGGLASRGVDLLGSAAACWTLTLAIPLFLLRQHARMVYLAQLQTGRALLIDVTVGGLQIAGLLLMAYVKRLDSASLALAVAGLACGAGGVLWLALNWPLMKLQLTPAWADFRRNWRFSRFLVATTPVAIVRSQLPLWMLAYRLGPGRTGLFAACVSITSLANPFLTGVNNFIGAKAAHIQAGEGDRALRRFILGSTAVISPLMSVFFVAMLLAGGRLVALAYGANYANLGLVIAILAAAVLANSLSGPAFRGLLARHRSDITLSTEVLMFAVQLTLGIWLVLCFGLTGAALAVFAGNLAGALYQLAVFTLQHPRAATEEEC